MKKRLLASILSLVLIVTLLPTAALAAGEWDGTSVDTDWYNTTNTEFTIDSAAKLAGLAQLVNKGITFQGQTIKLGADIDLGNEEWTPIGTGTYTNNYAPADDAHVFCGTFDGNGNTIYNLKMTKNIEGSDPDADANLGLFSITGKGAVIKNLTITNVNISTTGRNVGALAGFAYNAELDNITINGNINISGGHNVAGVCGMTRYHDMSATNITVSGVDGSVIKGKNIVGGIITEIAPNGSEQTFSNLSVENIAIEGVGGVGGIVGLLTNGSMSNVSVKNVALTGNTEWNSNSMGRIRMGSVVGLLGNSGPSTVSNVTVEGVTGKNLDGTSVTLPVVGANYSGSIGNATEAKVGDDYYATLTIALSKAESGDTITLLADVDVTGSITISDKLTIDLNGHTLTGTDTATDSFGLINIQPGADLTINDSSTDGTGRITLTAESNREWNAYSSVISNQRGKLTVNGGTIEHKGGTDMAYAIDNLTNTGAEIAETTINDGVIKSTYRAIRQFLNSSAEGVNNILTVNGGTIEGKNKSIWMQDANASANIGTLTVSDKATLVGNVYLYVTEGSTKWPVTVSIADAAFDESYTVQTGNVPDGITVNVAGGYWGISNTSGSYAAAIGGIRYNTLAEAINAAQPGDTVTLLTDITANSTVNINKSITLDGDDHKISGSTSPLLTLNSSANITVRKATLEAIENVVRYNYVNEGYAHTYQNCKISGGVYGIHYDGGGGKVVIDGCTIDGFNAFADSLEQVTIKDTTFDADQSGYAGANLWGYTEIENVTLVDEGKTTWLDVKATAEVIGGKVVKDGTELSLESYLDATAKVDTTYYDTLEDAVKAEGVTEITLVSDVDETFEVNKALTIHLNGNKIAETVTAAEDYTVAKGTNEWVFGLEESVISVTGVTLDKTTASVYVGDTTTLVATVTPADATIDGITWSSDDESIATVDASGVVTGVADGTATITATTEEGGYTATCTVTVSHRPSGGGGGGSTSYTIAVEDTKNGDITVSPSRASSGSTVTITVDPDSGYELDELTVLDKNGKEIKLTRKSDSKYTFKMPSGKVTIEATFAEIEAFENPFTDVAEGAYYYDAVLWAAENGITGGTSATTFSPAVTCTRAQTVTFLWRAAGSPEPETTVCPFTDVTPDKYYYDAVLWAVENGITSGTSATTFSPNATVTRAQNVTFLWRYDGSPVVSSGSFADVPADAYYASAVAWTVSEGVTNGTSATTFGPDANCTRAQIVTFLYRYMA